MKPGTFPLSIAAALVLGFAQLYFLAVCWSALGVYSPLPHWLIEHGVRGGTFQGAMFAADFFTQVVLSTPAALILLRLRPARLWVYLAAAIVPAFLWMNVNALGSWLHVDVPVSHGMLFVAMAMAWAQHLLPLPVAAWLLRRSLPRTPGGPAAAVPVLSSRA